MHEFILKRLIILLLAFFLGLGKVAYSADGLSVVPLLVVVFIVVSLYDINKLVPSFLSIKTILLFLLAFSLSVSELLGYNLLYTNGIVNFKLIVAILFFIVFNDYLNKDGKFKDIIFLSFAFGVVALLLISLYFPSIGYYYKGKYMIVDENPNSTGTRFALAAVFFCYFMLRGLKSKSFLFLFLLSFLILAYFTILTGSRGSLIFLIISSLILIIYSQRGYSFKITAVISSTILVLFGFGWLLGMEGDIGQKWGLAAEGDMAGRSDIWEIALNIFYNNPIMGTGYSQYLYIMDSAIGNAKDAHNLFVFLLATGGVVAFIIFGIFFSSLLYNAIRSRQFDQGLRLSLWLCALILALKTGGALVYLVLWFLYAVIASNYYVKNQENSIAKNTYK